MTPAVKFLRTVLLLPVKEAEERERKVQETVVSLDKGRRENARLRDLVQQSADDLHSTYDRLLERTTWGK